MLELFSYFALILWLVVFSLCNQKYFMRDLLKNSSIFLAWVEELSLIHVHM